MYTCVCVYVYDDDKVRGHLYIFFVFYIGLNKVSNLGTTFSFPSSVLNTCCVFSVSQWLTLSPHPVQSKFYLFPVHLQFLRVFVLLPFLYIL